MEVPQIELSDWTDTLKTYQKDSINTLIAKNGEEEAAKLWLGANGVATTKQFGGSGSSEPFWDRFVSEFRNFICGHEKYESERQQLSSQAPIANAMFVGVISGAIGSTLGFAASLLAPAVAILLFLVGKVGVNAYCKTS
ncbi:hypothetical protein [Paraferrimonas sp. SM1919]|uniref:hypothetical protein n=1 Tax=Paraferrimonas sp. SM1919 TaxID=2662263 RepID=UPI0013D2124D|nr:hypothetical protein [Paraferrimonas sp. SM1919]